MQKTRSLNTQGDGETSTAHYSLQNEPPLSESSIDACSKVEYETRVVLGDLKRITRLKDDLVYRDSIFWACDEDFGHYLEAKAPREVQMESYLSMKENQMLLKKCRHRAMKTV